MGIPIKPLTVEGGYFIMADVSACRDVIPKKYLESHDYDGEDSTIATNKVYTAEGKIPLDLAFCRWMAVEK